MRDRIKMLRNSLPVVTTKTTKHYRGNWDIPAHMLYAKIGNWQGMEIAYEGVQNGRAYNIRTGEVREINPVIVEVRAGADYVFLSPATGEMVVEETKYSPKGESTLEQKILVGYATYLTDGKKYYGIKWDPESGCGEIMTPYDTERVPAGTWKVLGEMADSAKIWKQYYWEQPVEVSTHNGNRCIYISDLRQLWLDRVAKREEKVQDVAKEKLKELVEKRVGKTYHPQTTTLEKWM